MPGRISGRIGDSSGEGGPSIELIHPSQTTKIRAFLEHEVLLAQGGKVPPDFPVSQKVFLTYLLTANTFLYRLSTVQANKRELHMNQLASRYRMNFYLPSTEKIDNGLFLIFHNAVPFPNSIYFLYQEGDDVKFNVAITQPGESVKISQFVTNFERADDRSEFMAIEGPKYFKAIYDLTEQG